MESLLIGLSVSFNLVVIGLFIYFRKGVEAYVDFRKSKALEVFKKELDRTEEKRRKMQLVAELFARRFNKPEEIYEFEKLNWELALFLPREIVCEISEKLVKAKTKFEVMDLFIKIRKELGKDDGLEAGNISYIAELSKDTSPHKK